MSQVVEMQLPMVWGAFAINRNKHNGGSDQIEAGVNKERDPDSFRES